MRVPTPPIDLTEAIHPDDLAATGQSIGDLMVVNRADADPSDVEYVLGADPTDPDGYTRSQFQWFRLPNGDLILGLFPQDVTYFGVTDRAGV